MNAVLVTGGAGFIGSHVVDLLIESGKKVIIADNLSSGKKEFVNPQAVFYQIDVSSQELEQLIAKEKPDGVIHLAAQVDVAASVRDPAYDANVNILGSLRLMDACKNHGVKRVVYASSCAVYGEVQQLPIQESFAIKPISFYGASKYVPEMYLKLYHQLYGLEYSILRYANVYGPRQTPKGEGGVVAAFLSKMANQQAVTIFGDGEQTRDFIYVKDVARANVLALEKKGSRILNISSNSSISINQLYRMLREIAGCPIAPEYRPRRDGDIIHSRLDNELAKNTLGWNPSYSLEQGLTETFRYYKEKI